MTDPVKVLPKLHEDTFDLLLLDIEMPTLNGFDVMRKIQQSTIAKQNIPILILTGCEGSEIRNRALTSGAQDFVNKPFDQTEVILRVKNLLQVRSSYLAQLQINEKLEKNVSQRTKDLNIANDVLIEKLALAAELRDTDTGKHVLRVGKYAELLAKLYGLPDEVTFLICKSAPLHDVGKIGIPDNILLKNGPLTREEMGIMMTHTQLGSELLANHESMVVKMAASIALSHHEKWDGTGYPKALYGASIPIEGRITALSDVFDALTSIRPYKKAWTIEKAVECIKKDAGTHFNPELVSLFTDNLPKFIAIREAYID